MKMGAVLLVGTLGDRTVTDAAWIESQIYQPHD